MNSAAGAHPMEKTVNPVLAGQNALVVGVANDSSIAYGCAKAFHQAGAKLALTYLNEKAKPHVAPLAAELEAEIVAPLDVSISGRRWRCCVIPAEVAAGPLFRL